MTTVVRCDTCGGTVVYDAAQEAALCLFCGADNLARDEVSEGAIPAPHGALTGHTTPEQAAEHFRRWARASWWTPSVIRDAQIQLRAMYLPAWWAKGDVETHWSGTVRASTQSGRAPTSGINTGTYQDMVPASQGLSVGELNELQPFRPGDHHPWSAEDSRQPYEPPAMSEEAAHQALTERVRARHLGDIQRSAGLHDAVASSLVHYESHALFMVPIYIGAFRFRNRPWRFLVNAQTGKLVGKAPIDRLKVLMVTGGSALVLAVLALVLSQS